jgi:hypothetical protein
MNPYLILAQVGITIGLMVGCWFYRGSIDAKSCQADKAAMQLAAQTEAAAIKSAAAKDYADADLKAQGVIYDYQKRVVSLSASSADALDTSNRLRSAIAIYATQPNAAGSGPVMQASGVSVCPADERVGRLADVAGILDADGLKASRDAATCAVKLTACEGWAGAVQSEFSKSQP